MSDAPTPPADEPSSSRRSRGRRLLYLALALAGAAVGALGVAGLATLPPDAEDLGSRDPARTRICGAALATSPAAPRLMRRARAAAGTRLIVELFRAPDTCYMGLRVRDQPEGFLLIAPVRNGDVGDITTHGQGCGEGFATYLVPDWVFQSACDDHDLCYLFHGSPRSGARRTRAGCDRDMVHASERSCRAAYHGRLRSPIHGSCWLTSQIYWMGVRTLGSFGWSNDE